jgi:hypothetical protein
MSDSLIKGIFAHEGSQKPLEVGSDTPRLGGDKVIEAILKKVEEKPSGSSIDEIVNESMLYRML